MNRFEKMYMISNITFGKTKLKNERQIACAKKFNKVKKSRKEQEETIVLKVSPPKSNIRSPLKIALKDEKIPREIQKSKIGTPTR